MNEPPRLRILIVTRNLPPLVGGMERLNWHMAEELANYADVCVIGPTGAKVLGPGNVTIHEVPLKPLPWFLVRAQWKAWRCARRWRPDVVLAGSGLAAPLAWLAGKACGARTAVYVHGLDIAVRHAMYRALWLPMIRRIDRVIANSQATKALAVAAGVQSSRIGIIHPGVDLSADSDGSASAKSFRAVQQLGDRPLLLSVGRLSRRKGMCEFVADVLPAVVAEMPDVMLLIVGEAPRQALHATAHSQESILAVAEARGVSGNIRFFGFVSDRELVTIYQAANVHVFPVQHIPHDPEGFGMVAVEAAVHGLPTVAYATGGIVDAVEEGQSGRLVPPGNVAIMIEAILDMLRGMGAMRTSSKAFAANFGWPVFGERVLHLLKHTDD